MRVCYDILGYGRYCANIDWLSDELYVWYRNDHDVTIELFPKAR